MIRKQGIAALLVCLGFALAAPLGAQQQSATTQEGSAADAQPDSAPPPQRIVDRPVTSGAASRVLRVPLLPFVGLGNVLEKGLLEVEENRIPQRLTLRQTWLRRRHIHPQFGAVGGGSGLAIGAEFLHDDVLHRGIRVSVPAFVSTKHYQHYDSLVSVPMNPGRWLRFEFGAQFRSRPEDPFFGIGPSSIKGDRTSYFLQDRSGGALLAAEWGRRFRADFGFRYTNTGIFRGRDTDAEVPSAEQTFPNLAGLDGAALLGYGFSASFKALDNPLDPKRGFRTRARFYWADSLRSADFNFLEYGLETIGYIPFGGPRTLAVRMLGEFREPGRNGQVPFFALATLGGGTTLRGFRARRFHDSAALLFTGEYRYKVWRLADFVMFTDQGQVAREPGDLAFGNFRGVYGAGVQLKSRTGVLMRFEVARSNDGVRVHVTFSPEF